MMMKTLLKVGMLASLVTAISAPAIMPNVVFAQADVRQEDRRADRQQDRQNDRREDRSNDRREDRQQDCLMDRQQNRREDRRTDQGGRGR